MGILPAAAFRLRNAHVLQQGDGFLPGLGSFQVLMEAQGLLNLCADGLEGVQAGHRVLQNHSDFAPADGQPFFLRGKAGQVFSVVPDAAVIHPAVDVVEAHKGLGQHALTGAAFPHDGQGFPLVQLQGNVPDGVQHLAAQVKLDIQMLHPKNGMLILFLHEHFLPAYRWFLGSAASAKALPIM